MRQSELEGDLVVARFEYRISKNIDHLFLIENDMPGRSLLPPVLDSIVELDFLSTVNLKVHLLCLDWLEETEVHTTLDHVSWVVVFLAGLHNH